MIDLGINDLALAADACQIVADGYRTLADHAFANGNEERGEYWEREIAKLRRVEEALREAVYGEHK